jgi:hypothetical protein
LAFTSHEIPRGIRLMLHAVLLPHLSNFELRLNPWLFPDKFFGADFFR